MTLRKISLVYYDPTPAGACKSGRHYGSFKVVSQPDPAQVRPDKFYDLKGMFEALQQGAYGTYSGLQQMEAMQKHADTLRSAIEKSALLQNFSSLQSLVDQNIARYNKQMGMYAHYVGLWTNETANNKPPKESA
jgi:hypothetical protein